ncbi:probable G-protein coupled receptor 139 [Hemitrygon akajei]|uniref:probable G-protein coupled receptor 139 n=1 Tax=Hemitrygon akajei TaxID=2704970 RepID=UPI003BF95F85
MESRNHSLTVINSTILSADLKLMNDTETERELRKVDFNVQWMGKDVFWAFTELTEHYGSLPLEDRIVLLLKGIQPIYFALLVIIAVPGNLLTILILSRGKCGLSKCVTLYLVAMAAVDLIVVIFDLILRHITMVYWRQFHFPWPVPVCNFHAVILYAATDCSVWFTVSFTFDRFVAICCQKLKSTYCTERTVAVVLGTVTVLNCLKDLFWYFMLTGEYNLLSDPWICWGRGGVVGSTLWATIEFTHYFLNPVAPFFLILLFNTLTVKQILTASRARNRLRGQSSGEKPRDAEMESRRKSIILLFAVSGNFIVLWAVFMIHSIWNRLWWLGFRSIVLPNFVQKMGFILQHLSCCTNTAIYAVTQRKFREQLKSVFIYPVTLIVTFKKR